MMGYREDVSPGFVPTYRHAIYNSSIADSASASNASIWSSTSNVSTGSESSQTSDDGSSGSSSDGESCDAYCKPQSLVRGACAPPRSIVQPQPAVPAEARQNPRRSAAASRSRAPPPTLVRQSDRKVNFVDSLVDSSTQIVDAIWPTSSAVCRSELGSKAVLPLRTFIQETLRRSRTSYSTLQVALYYLILIKPHVPARGFLAEQTDDRPTAQALQCGRRMFLSALILASKYLQDRNYSARAWSKISGLNTQEINQNEMTFLQSVNWKLHIADDVFQRWSEIVVKYTPPPSPPSPGGCPQVISQQQQAWRDIILGLNVELTNLESLIRTPPALPRISDLSPASPRSILNSAQEGRMYMSSEVQTVPKRCETPMVMDPMQASSLGAGRAGQQPLTFLPTPRLTPQSSGMCTPAAGHNSAFPKAGSMSMAMAHANHATLGQTLERRPAPSTSSPQAYFCTRRSSLANSVSNASSPESMVSDSSRTSRSSSISSASSVASATLHSNQSVPLRFRPAKLCNEKRNMNPSITSVPEDHDEQQYESSPETYTGPVGGSWGSYVGNGMISRKRSLEDMVSDPASDAARALQELRDCRGRDSTMASPNSPNYLQQNVRDLLDATTYGRPSWSESFASSRSQLSTMPTPTYHAPEFSSSKRVCCATEAVNGFKNLPGQPAMGVRGPGMWQGILN